MTNNTIDMNESTNSNIDNISKNSSTRIFDRGTVATVAGGGTAVGATIGSFVGAAIAPDIAQAASNAAREAVKENGDKISNGIIEGSFLSYIPFMGFIARGQVTELAHTVGESTYKQVKKEVVSKSAIAGGVAGGALTVAVMEGINLAGAINENYITPYFVARSEEKKTKEEYRKLQQDFSTDDENVDSVDEDFGLGDFVVMSKKP